MGSGCTWAALRYDEHREVNKKKVHRLWSKKASRCASTVRANGPGCPPSRPSMPMPMPERGVGDRFPVRLRRRPQSGQNRVDDRRTPLTVSPDRFTQLRQCPFTATGIPASLGHVADGIPACGTASPSPPDVARVRPVNGVRGCGYLPLGLQQPRQVRRRSHSTS
jgi:hypothetical protein